MPVSQSASESLGGSAAADGSERAPSFVESSSQHPTRTAYFEQLREMTRTPTPLADIMTDPKWMKALTRPKSRASRHSSKPSHQSGGGNDTSVLLSAVFNAEERQVNELKIALHTAGDRLEYEMQRADAAETQANFAERKLREHAQRIANLITTQHEQDLAIARLKEEGKRLQLVIETLKTENDRGNRTIEGLRQRRRRDDSEIRELNESVRQYEGVLNKERLKAVTRQQERYVNGIVEGREEGWNSAKRVEREKLKKVYLQGFEAGRVAGHEEARSYDGYHDDGRSARSRGTDEVSLSESQPSRISIQ